MLCPLLKTKFAFVFMLLSLLVGCKNADTALTAVSEDSQNIVNGKTVTSMTEARKSTVFILSVREDNSTGICTGTLIAKNLVLTAGHCAPKPDQIGVKSYIGFGVNYDEAFGSERNFPFHRVIDIKTHEGYNPQMKALVNAPYDLALFKFKGALPAGFQTRPLPNLEYKIPAIETLEMIGYGFTSATDTEPNQLRQTELPVNRLTELVQIHETDKDGKTDDFEFPVPGTIIVKQPDTGVCVGDSGGPLYVRDTQGQLTFVGVTSMGIVTNPSELSTENKVCRGVSLFVDLRTQLKWIKEASAALSK